MRLVFAGKQLKDEDPISNYVTESGMTVHLIARSVESTQNNNSATQQQQQQPPNPFGDIMGMVGNLLGNPQTISANGPQISMSFNNPNMNGVGSLLNNLGIRIPPPPTQPSSNQNLNQPQPRPQQEQQRQQQSNNINNQNHISYA